MQYRYGDSSEAPFDVDYLALAESIIDYAVRTILAAERVRNARANISERMRSADDHIAQIEALGRRLTTALEFEADGIEQPVDRVTEAIARAARDEIGAGVARVNGRLSDLSETTEQDIEREHARCVLALSRLLAAHDMPDCNPVLTLDLRDRGGYSATLRMIGPVGLDVDFALDVPDDSPLCMPLRVRDLIGSVKLNVPVPRPWPLAGGKIVVRGLGKLLISCVTHTNGGTRIELRDRRKDSGFDVTVDPTSESIHIEAVGSDKAEQLGPLEVGGQDQALLTDLHDELLALALPLSEARDRMVRAELDGTPVSVLSDPEMVALRLIEWMAPTLREIASRSGSSTELVIELAYARGARRIARSRTQLRKSIDTLPDVLRGSFFCLGLAAPTRPRATPPPPPLPRTPKPSPSGPRPRTRAESSIDDGWRLPTAS